MFERHPDVTDEDLGIRAFKVKRGKAVERAIERLRHGLGPVWSDLNDSEIEELEWVLGELWAYVARANWEDLRFGLLSMGDVLRIIMLGGQMRRHSRSSIECLRDVEQIVRDKSGSAPAEA